MINEVPASSIRDARDRAALIICAAEAEAFRVRAAARSAGNNAILDAKKEIEDSNSRFLKSIDVELSICRARRMSEGSQRADEIRERASRRISEVTTFLLTGFDRYLTALGGPRKGIRFSKVNIA